MDIDVVLSLKKRYANHPPLLISRSIEKAKDESELFDILDTIPSSLPVTWDNKKRRWVNCGLFSELTMD